MSFWQALGTYARTDGMPTKTIRLCGSLQLQSNLFGPGAKRLCAIANGTIGWDIWPVEEARAIWLRWYPYDEAWVYWLPWQQYQVTEVTMDALNGSGCDYFLTSEFSGCRFVLANDRLQHIAYAAGMLRNGTSADRDFAQDVSWFGNQPARARTFSITKVRNAGATGNLVADGYGVANWNWTMNMDARALVVGRKVTQDWHFYMQKWLANAPAATIERIGI